jgi:hypothetical protein
LDARNFASAAAECGRGASALEIVQLAERNSTPPADQEARSRRLGDLAYAYASAGDIASCKRVLDEALKLRADVRSAVLLAEIKRRTLEAEPDEEPEVEIDLDARGPDGLPLSHVANRVFDESMLAHVGFALARAGHVDEAVSLGEKIDRNEQDNARLWVARGAAAAGDLAAAKRIADTIKGAVSVESAARDCAAEFAGHKRWDELREWVESRPTDHARFVSCIGAVEGMTGRRFWEPRLGI